MGKKCENCGKKVGKKDKSCPSCGHELSGAEGNPVLELYHRYRSENRLPYLVMVLLGSLTLLGGLFFLVVYLADRYDWQFGGLSDPGKLSGWLLASAGLGVGSFVLGRRKMLLGSALSLSGLLWNFVGLLLLERFEAYPFWHSPATAFWLTVAATALGLGQSAFLRDRVLPVLLLLMVVSVPFVLRLELRDPEYLGYLLGTSLAMVYLTDLVDWRYLGATAFAASHLMLELLVVTQGQDLRPYHLAYFHGFSLVFLYLEFFEIRTEPRGQTPWPSFFAQKLLKRSKSMLSPLNMTMISVNILLFSANLSRYFLETGYWFALGWIFVGNAVPYALGLLLMGRRMSRDMLIFFGGILGFYSALGIWGLVPNPLMGAAWLAESAAVLLLGFHYRSEALRWLGYATLLAAVLNSFYSLWMIAELWMVEPLNRGMVNLLALGPVMALLVHALYRYREALMKFEHGMFMAMQELVSFWFLLAWLALAWQHDPLLRGFHFWSLLPGLFLAYRGKVEEYPLTYWVGVALLGLSLLNALQVWLSLLPGWQGELWHLGFLSYLFAGLLLVLVRYGHGLAGAASFYEQKGLLVREVLFLKTVQTDQLSVVRTDFFSVVGYLQQVWLVGLFFTALGQWMGAWFSYTSITLSLWLISEGILEEKPLTRWGGYLLYAWFLGVALLWAIGETPAALGDGSFLGVAYSYAQLGLFVGGYRAFLLWLPKKRQKWVLDRITEGEYARGMPAPWQSPQRFGLLCLHFVKGLRLKLMDIEPRNVAWPRLQRRLTHKAFHLWVGASYLLVLLRFVPAYTLPLLFPLALYFLAVAGRSRDGFLELLGLGTYLLLSAAAFNHWAEVGFSLSRLGAIDKATLAGAYATLWLARPVYRWLMPHSLNLERTREARVLFFVLLPLLLVFLVWRRLPEWMPLAVWLAAALSMLNSRMGKNRLLYREYQLLALVAIAFDFAAHSLPGFLTGLTTLALLLALARLRLALQRQQARHPERAPARPRLGRMLGIDPPEPGRREKPRRDHIFTQSLLIYYLGVMLMFFWFWNFPNDLASGLFIAAAYFLAIVLLRKPVRVGKWVLAIPEIAFTYLVPYRLAYAFMFLGMFEFLGYDFTLADFPYRPHRAVSLVMATLLLGQFFHVLAYDQYRYPGRWDSPRWVFELRVLQLVLLFYYTNLLYFLTLNFGGALLTYAMVSHGILLFFATLRDRFRGLQAASILLLAAAMLKFILIDLWVVSIVERILLFMSLGVMLSGAAMLYGYIKDKEDRRRASLIDKAAAEELKKDRAKKEEEKKAKLEREAIEQKELRRLAWEYSLFNELLRRLKAFLAETWERLTQEPGAAKDPKKEEEDD